jgi:hypothetical protein
MAIAGCSRFQIAEKNFKNQRKILNIHAWLVSQVTSLNNIRDGKSRKYLTKRRLTGNGSGDFQYAEYLHSLGSGLDFFCLLIAIGSIDPHAKTIIQRRAYMNIGHILPFQQHGRGPGDVFRFHDLAGAVDDAVGGVVAFQQITVPLEKNRRRPTVVDLCCAGFGMEKNRTGLGVWLLLGKRTVGQNQITFTRGHILLAMPAGYTVTV